MKKLKDFLVRHNIIKTIFSEEGFVYIDDSKLATNEITNVVKWLGTQYYYGYYKNKDKKLIENFEFHFPEYKGYIRLY